MCEYYTRVQKALPGMVEIVVDWRKCRFGGTISVAISNDENLRKNKEKDVG